MSLGITWVTLEEATAKYSLGKASVLRWVREGVVRAEQSADQVVRINVDDLELMVQDKATSN